MAKEKISPYEFFASVFLVPYGSAVLFFVGVEAKQDAWLIMLIYILPAFLLQQVYISLFKYYPQDTMVTWMPKIFGRFIGKLLGGIYVIYFAYLATRVLRDFVGIINISAMSGTPLWILTFVLGITVTYGVYTGVENLARIASTFLVFMMIIIGILLILFLRTPNIIEWNNLLPFLPKGILEPVARSWKIITFPYGETIIATMLYVHVNEPHKIRKAAFTAIIVEGIILSILHVCFIICLGVNFATKELFPLLDALRLIRVTGFLDRLDLFIIVVVVFDGFIKIGFFMYAATAGTAQLFGINKEKSLVWPMGIVVCTASLFISKNFPQHLKIGLDFTPKYIHLPLQVFIPILALIVYYIRFGLKRQNEKPEKTEQSVD